MCVDSRILPRNVCEISRRVRFCANDFQLSGVTGVFGLKGKGKKRGPAKEYERVKSLRRRLKPNRGNAVYSVVVTCRCAPRLVEKTSYAPLRPFSSLPTLSSSRFPLVTRYAAAVHRMQMRKYRAVVISPNDPQFAPPRYESRRTWKAATIGLSENILARSVRTKQELFR